MSSSRRRPRSGPTHELVQQRNFLAKLVLRPTDVDTIRITGGFKPRPAEHPGNCPASAISRAWSRASSTNGGRTTHRTTASARNGSTTRRSASSTASTSWPTSTRPTPQADTYQLRGALERPIPTNARTSQFYYNQNVTGAELQMNTDTKLFDLRNYLTYGLSFAYTTTTRPRDRWQITLATGARTQSVAARTSPTRTSRHRHHPGQRLPAGRDHGPGRPAHRHAGGAGRLLQAQSQSRPLLLELDRRLPQRRAQLEHLVSASPKLGTIYRFSDIYSAYFQYATGFRAPPYDNANFGFTNAASFYQILPNANLKPETANSFEIGYRGKYQNGSSWQLTGFYNLYNNFLETVVVNQVGPITQFQYVNLTNVTIWGVEARGEYRFAPDWSVLGWTAFAQGTDQRTGLPVDSGQAHGRRRRGCATAPSRAWSPSSSAR